MDAIDVIDTNFTPKMLTKAAFLKQISDGKPVTIQAYDYHINIEVFSTEIISESQPSAILTHISHAGFLSLRKGDTIYIKVQDSYYLSEVYEQATYNADADEPCMEIETSNGFATEDSVYVYIP